MKIEPSFVVRMSCAALSVGASAGASAERLHGGAYEVEVRLELPHLEDLAQTKRIRVCLSADPGANHGGLGVLSDNNPLARCPLSNLRHAGDSLSFDIACEGRNAGSATARFTLGQERFRGRIEMKMGGKNMTMTEVQTGRRTGPCEDAASPDAATPPPSGL